MIKTDCIHFKLDRPCSFHKEKGIKCAGCRHYSSVKSSSGKAKNILVIKLDAMGDVLRSTFILPGLKEKYPKSRITWITAPESVSILEGNPRLDRIWPFDTQVFRPLVSENFDIAINLDLSPQSLSLATLAVAKKKVGFYLDKNRKIKCSNPHAKRWLLMSSFDDIKKKNTETYQHHMAKIIGLARSDYRIFTPLKKESVSRAEEFAKCHNFGRNVIVGINPGAGKRWKLKKWTDEGYIKLIEKLQSIGAKVLLFGGKNEKELIDKLIRESGGKAVSTGVDNSLNDFFALLNLCEIVITTDSLALHAALGLKKKVIAVFGPTSASEIEMYKQGEKIVSPIGCTCCYIPDCNKKPNCMELIKVDRLYSGFFKVFGNNIEVI
ncbi:MAG: glycosyltransferase family 9 protein [Endomicrobiales bacterium]|nr:glycosyltransferase family 9 protein [Endomicrobiales bacterium]